MRASRRRGVIGVLMAGLTAAAAAQQPPRRLTAGATIDATLKGGEVHVYEVELAAGTYFGATFDQRGGDVRPVIIAPDGRILYDYDGSEYGWEPAMIIAPVSGIYRLEARSPRARRPTGPYQLHVDAIRTPTADDELRTRIGTLQTDALAAFRTRTPAGTQHARAILQEILKDWQTLGDAHGEANALRALGAVSNGSNDFQSQVDYNRREVEIRRQLDDDYGEADALLNVCLGEHVLGDLDGARAACERSLALHRAAGRAGPQSDVLEQIATVDRITGELGSSLQAGYDALELARRTGDGRREFNALLAIGLTHLDAGELEQGIDVLRSADTTFSEDAQARARVASSIGGALIKLGDDANAEPLLREALSVWTARGWPSDEATALGHLGEIYLRRGDVDMARQLLEQAAAKAAQAKFIRAEGELRTRLGELLIQQDDLDQAGEQFATAESLLGELSSESIARTLVVADRAKLALARGDLRTARQLAEDAVARSETVRARAESVRDRTAMLASSQTVYETLVRILMAQDAADPSRGLAARGVEASERGRARSLLDLILDERAEDAPAKGKTSGPLDELRGLQRRIHAKAQALDQARGANTTAAASIARSLDELFDQYRLAEARMASERPEFAAVTSPEPISIDTIRSRLLDRDTVLVEYMLAEPESYAWVISEDHMASYRLAGRGVIESAARQFQVEITRAHAGPSPANGQPARTDAAAALARLLLPPVESIPAGKRVLLVVPGALQQVPFAALPFHGSPLVARHDLVHAPSASIAAAVRTLDAGRRPAPRTVAVFADPVFDAADPRVTAARTSKTVTRKPADSPDPPLTRAIRSVDGDRAGLTRLPFTRLEADAIAALVPPASMMKATDFSASLARVTDPVLANYRILHFATHGLLDTRTPELSGLVFSLVDAAGRPQDGFLRLDDIMRLKINAELVVLSGCDTGLGRTVEGEGIIGLTRGFVAAGARRVVASLWNVDDMATAEFMSRFYRQMLQRRLAPAAALAAAQREMAATARWHDPYFWSGFVIQGEWR